MPFPARTRALLLALTLFVGGAVLMAAPATRAAEDAPRSDAPQSELGESEPGESEPGESAATRSLEDAFSDAEEEAVKRLVREYILDNPDIIREAIRVLRQREQQAQADRQEQAVAANRDALHDPGLLPVLGNPDGDVTVVEFFDYNCPYCRGIAKEVIEVVKADGNVRLILKELPILRESSRMAARAALAAAHQGAYEDFHTRLMTEVSEIDRDNIMALAERMDLDVADLKSEMEARATTAAIQKTYRLAKALEIEGTPAFVVGDRLVPGAIGKDRLKKLIADARNGK